MRVPLQTWGAVLGFSVLWIALGAMIVPGARKLGRLSYEEMLELAASGAKVLALRSVEYARNHGLPLHVRSSFGDSEGTWIGKEAKQMDQAIISGIAHDASHRRCGYHKLTTEAVRQ